MKTQSHVLKNKKGFLSIELMLVAGVIVILVVVSMTVFSSNTSSFSNNFGDNVSTALQQHSSLNAAIIGSN